MPLILLLIDLPNTWTANNNTRLQRLQKTGIQLVGFGASALIGMGAGALISAGCVGTAGNRGINNCNFEYSCYKRNSKETL